MKKQEILNKVVKYSEEWLHREKQFIPGKTYIPSSGAIISPQDVEYIVEAALQFWYTDFKMCKAFRNELSKVVGKNYVTLCNSGSSASLLAMSALTEKYSGKYVITTAVGFPTTVAPIYQCGKIPIYIDIDPLTFTPNVTQFYRVMNKHKKDICGVVFAHTLGFPFDELLYYMEIGKSQFFMVDACDALGAGRDITGYDLLQAPDVVTLSFFPAHQISCSKNTPIPYIDRLGNFQLDRIEDIYNKYKKETIEDIKIISFNDDGKIEWNNPTSIIKHKIRNKKLIKVTLQHGREVDVTEDHSVFVLDKSLLQIKSKKTSDLSLEDYVVCSSKLPQPPCKSIINVIDHFRDKDAYVSNFDLQNLICVKNADYKYQYRIRNSMPIRYLSKQLSASELDVLSVGFSQTNEKVSAYLNVDKDLCRLVGYFLAEGSYARDNGIVFSFHRKEKDIIFDVKSIIKSIFNLNAKVYGFGSGKGINLRVDSKNVNYIFRKIFNIDSGAKNKRIPSFIYSSDDDCVKSFVYGYTKGDGSFRDEGENHYRIDVTSVSKELLNDFQYLLSMIGIGASFYRRNKGGRKEICGVESNSNPNYSLCFSGYFYDDWNKTIIFQNIHHKSEYISQIPINDWVREILKGQSISSKYKTISKQRLLKILKTKNMEIPAVLLGNLCFLKVRSIKRIEYDYDEYVYDFSVLGKENFYGGRSGVFLHNTTAEGGAVLTDDKELDKIINSYASWGKDCYCLPGQNGVCGKRFKQKFDKMPDGYDHKYTFTRLGYNMKMTEFQAALGLSQLSRLDSFVARRVAVCKVYELMLKEVGINKYFDFVDVPEWSSPSPFGFPLIRKDDAPFSTQEVINYLEENKIGTRRMFGGNLTRQPAFNVLPYEALILSGSDKLMNDCFWIGCHPGITDEMMEYVICKFEEFIKEK